MASVKVILADHNEVISVDQSPVNASPIISSGDSIARTIRRLEEQDYDFEQFKQAGILGQSYQFVYIFINDDDDDELDVN
ncbi:hypothetical protein [Vallitalea guaymasensis]|uniref:hypothetical protein n=1 Tax=Vallitalea guaymasensis TaxID=1185412 RepID=UPI002354C591|nr:hypothetical protein [Vallitalea guaymasensis]